MNSSVKVCELIDIEKSYGPERVLGPLSLSLERGTVTGLLGPNGSGKSTLLQVAAGILPPDAGVRRTAGGRIGYAPQAPALYPALTGRDNLRFWAGVQGLNRREAAPRIEAALEAVELTDKAAKRVETYSGGQRQRLNAAAALLLPCELLLLDEPTAGCDGHSAEILLDIFSRAAREHHAAVLLVDHDRAELEKICDRILTLTAGRLDS